MKLLTDEIINQFEVQKRRASRERDRGGDITPTKIIAKFFNPTGIGTWYATEYDQSAEIFFGFVSLFNDHNDELGYFSLQELQEFKGQFGLGIERDRYFGEHTLDSIIAGDRP